MNARIDAGLLVRLTAALVAGTLVAWLSAAALGLSAGSADAAVVLRTLLSALVMSLLTRIWVRRAYAGPQLLRTVVLAALLSYALSPAAWAGRALAGQLVLEAGVATVLVDLVLWCAVVVGSAASTRPRAVVERRPYQLS